MSWRNIRLIFLREVRDQLRDRRTLFMVAVLPLLLYPALGIGTMQMTVLFTEQPRTVVMLGAEHLPQDPPLLENGQIARFWFPQAQDFENLQVVTDLPSESEGENGIPRQERDRLLDKARKIREVWAEWKRLEQSHQEAVADQNPTRANLLADEAYQNKERLSALFGSADLQVLLVVPEGLGDQVKELTRRVAERQTEWSDLLDPPRLSIIRNSADEKSLIAFRRVEGALENWEQEVLKQRLDEAELPQALITPINAESDDLAQKEQIEANLWSKMFPAMLIVMAVTGAFYPAVDLAAGEKERGTMETLLICPASRGELVIGKFFTVMLFSAATALLNLASMGMTGKYMVSIAGSRALNGAGAFEFPSPIAFFWILLLLIPLAALFSALCLALATFARSSKEGQYYLTPLLVVTLGLTMFCLSPAVEIDPFYSVMPVVGIALLLKGLLLGNVSLFYLIPVMVTSVGYSLLALWWAIEQFKSEEVLFREAERFEFGLWLRHLLRDKEPTPSFAEAGICFALMMFLQFAALKFMQDVMHGAFQGNSAAVGSLLMRLLMMQQLVIIATPALLMAVMLTTSVRKTLRIRLPNWRMLACAALLPLALHPLSIALAERTAWFFPPIPKSAQVAMEVMADAQQPLWFVLLAFAITPAICEELAFRGFILSGFLRSHRTGLAIVFSSLTFGIIHTFPQQVFNASLLGLVLGLIAVRGKSLLPCIAFHAIYNSLEVVRGQLGVQLNPQFVDGTILDLFVTLEQNRITYDWPLLVVAAALAIVLLTRIVHGRTPGGVPTRPAPGGQSPLGHRSEVPVA